MRIVSVTLLNILTLGNHKVSAMALWPFIIFRDKTCSADPVMLNHERIHHRQQTEMLILPFYVCYFAEYWTAMFRNGFRHHQSYMEVSFEQEAYAHEQDLKYLDSRPFLASFAFLLKKWRKK